jgi:lipopolysaccharide transport system permease protein
MSYLKPHHWDYIFYKAIANIRAESSKYYLSFLWWILQPIMLMGLYYLVFAVILERRTPDFVAFLLVGISTFLWTNQTTTHCMQSIQQGRGLMNQVEMPKIIFPSVFIFMDMIKFAFVFIVLVFYLNIFGGIPAGLSYLALPLILVVHLLFTALLGYIAAAVIPFLPDLSFVITLGLRVLRYLSGIFFPLSSVPEDIRFYFYLNPMAVLIEEYRNILIYGQWPNWMSLGLVGLFCIIGLALVFALIRRLDHIYPRVCSL